MGADALGLAGAKGNIGVLIRTASCRARAAENFRRQRIRLPEGRSSANQMLEGDPIELAKMILALGDLLQRTLLGRAELEVGSGFHIRRSIRACARRQCGAVAQRHAVATGKGAKPLCPRIFLRAACNQSWPRLDPGLILTVTLSSRDTQVIARV